MSILTHKMKEARKDTVGNNVEFWFPMNDTASPFTEIVSGNTTADGSATYDTAHAPTMLIGPAATSTGNALPYTIPTTGSIVLCGMWNVVSAGAFAKVSVGNIGSGPHIQIQQTANPASSFDDGNLTPVTCTGLTSPTPGQDYFQAGVLDIDADTIANYDAITTADVAANGTPASTSSVTVAGTVIADELTVNVTFRQHTYGICMFYFASGTPADLTTGLQWMRDQWVVGHKLLYPGWVDVT